jgi:hypothetical protein
MQIIGSIVNLKIASIMGSWEFRDTTFYHQNVRFMFP